MKQKSEKKSEKLSGSDGLELEEVRMLIKAAGVLTMPWKRTSPFGSRYRFFTIAAPSGLFAG